MAKKYNGIYFGMSREEYDAIDAVSQSALKNWVAIDFKKGTPRRKTRALHFGSAYHNLALEGFDTFHKRYHVFPDNPDFRTAETKERVAKIKEHYENRKIPLPECFFKIDEFNTLSNMYSRLQEDKETWSIIQDASEMNEVAVVGDMQGVYCKSLIDMVRDYGDTTMCIDLKTTSATSRDEFEDHIAEFGYDIQGAFNTMIYAAVAGSKVPTFGWIVQSKYEPYDVWRVRLPWNIWHCAKRWVNDFLVGKKNWGLVIDVAATFAAKPMKPLPKEESDGDTRAGQDGTMEQSLQK